MGCQMIRVSKELPEIVSQHYQELSAYGGEMATIRELGLWEVPLSCSPSMRRGIQWLQTGVVRGERSVYYIAEWNRSKLIIKKRVYTTPGMRFLSACGGQDGEERTGAERLNWQTGEGVWRRCRR